MSECPFTPPYPVPLSAKPALFKRLITGWNSWIHTLFDRAYTMKMGETHLPNLDVYIVNDLPIVDRILLDDTHEFPKHPLLNDLLDPLIGNAGFSANGTDWENQRQMVNPAFAHTNLKRVFPVMADAVGEMLDHIRSLDLARPVELDPLMTHVAADIIYRTIFSEPLGRQEADQIYHAFHGFQKNIQPSAMLSIYRLPLLGYRRRAIKAAGRIHEVFSPLVRARYDAWHGGAGERHDDILQSLLEARHPETGQPFSFEHLLDQISFVFLAGHETSASALTWALYLLSECPDWQDRIGAEIDRITDGEEIGFDHLRQMEGVRNLFKETLRLYPPVSFFIRAATRPTEMRDKKLKPGAMLVVSPWLIQRNSDNWACPHAFDPDRFARPEEAEAVKTAWLPFSKGPRVCVGAGFAQQEAMLVIASFARAFRLAYPAGPKPEPVSRLTLRPKKAVRLNLAPRG